MTDLQQWEAMFEQFIEAQMADADAAHDMEHIRRVVKSAKQLAVVENARLDVVVPAAWLHDCVTVAKNSPQRSQASRMAAEAAAQFLGDISYPAATIPAIQHAIICHSFSANIAPETIEAQVVQDADRLDAIGAIGISRCLMLSVSFSRHLYHPDDPFPMGGKRPLNNKRPLNDKKYAIDHFYTKLLTLGGTMKTAAGRAEAQQRTQFMDDFLTQLGREIEN